MVPIRTSAGCYVFVLLCHDDGPTLARVGITEDPVKWLSRRAEDCAATPREMLTIRTFARSRAQFVVQHLRDVLQPWRAAGQWFRIAGDESSLLHAAVLHRLTQLRLAPAEGFAFEPVTFAEMRATLKPARCSRSTFTFGRARHGLARA